MLGFRNPLDQTGVAGSDAVTTRIFVGDFQRTGAHVFVLSNPDHLWRFYRLDYVLSYSADGPASGSPHAQNVVVKLLDVPGLLNDLWRIEASLALAATEVGNVTVSGTGFDVRGGIAFPRGVNAKIAVEDTVPGGVSSFVGAAFESWSARVLVTVLAREVSR